MHGGPDSRINGVTNEPGTTTNPKLLPGGRPTGSDGGINQTWADCTAVLDELLGGVGQAGTANSKVRCWNNDVTMLLNVSANDRNQALAFLRGRLGAGAALVWYEVHRLPIADQY